jgi:hypothetical protein
VPAGRIAARRLALDSDQSRADDTGAGDCRMGFRRREAAERTAHRLALEVERLRAEGVTG